MFTATSTTQLTIIPLSLLILLVQVWTTLKSFVHEHKRAILIVVTIVLITCTLTLVPQATTYACAMPGICPCPGC